MASTPDPILANGLTYSAYIEAARTNLAALHTLAVALKDDEFAATAQRMADEFADSAADALFLIAEANETAREDIEDRAISMERPTAALFGAFR